MENLHCGACMTKFDSVKLLSEHLQNCPEALALLPIYYLVAFGGDKMGHPLASFIYCFHKATKQNLIRRYAYAVADDLDIIERAKLHRELCAILDFPYKEFRPFESSAIIKRLSRKESLEYLCREIFTYAHCLK